MDSEKVAIGILALIIGAMIFFMSAPVVTVGNNVSLPTKTQFVTILPKNAANGVIKLETKKAIPAGTSIDIDVLNNGASESREQATAREQSGISATYTRYRPLVAPAYNFPFSDFGTIASYKSGEVIAGLRTSPVRLLFGTTAPDLLISNKGAGVGLSFYGPPDILGSACKHWGLGFGRLWPFGHGDSYSAIYLSFSTYDF